MKLVVVGGNGKTGRQIVLQARDAGHKVVAAVRRPETMSDVTGIVVKRIDLTVDDTLSAAFDGADAVVMALGHGGLKASSKPTTLYSDGVRAIRRAMRSHGIKRLVVLSSGGVVEDTKAPWFYRSLIRPYLVNNYVDMARMEAILEESEDIQWTAVRLTYLLEGQSKPFAAIEGEIGRGSFKIHVVDAARFVVEELSANQWVGGHPVLGYITGPAQLLEGQAA